MDFPKRVLLLCCCAGFLLGSFRGYLALWKDGQPDPAQIFPVNISLLPPADQQALGQGIYVRNNRDLNQLLEDYLS